MAMNPNIILSGRVAKLPDPMEAYGRELGARNAMMQYQTAQQAQQEQNALRDFMKTADLKSPETRNKLMGYGKSGMEMAKALDDRRKAELDQEKQMYEMMGQTATFIMANPSMAEQALMRFAQQTGDDVTDELAEIAGLDEEGRRQWAAGHAADLKDLLPDFDKIDRGGQIDVVGRDKITGKPVGQTQTYGKTMAPGEAERIGLDRQRLALEGRRVDLAEKGGADAPFSASEVVDPADPTRMLRINARTYKGGTLGSEGVIGVSGKEPTNAAKETQTDRGRADLDTQIANLRDMYSQLQASGGITDTNRGGLANIQAGLASSGVGQASGRLFGTKDQSLRNQIAQSRPLLLQAIKQATGMSAKQMDSNVELKMYLAAATDPQLDVQANFKALDNLSKLYGLGGPTAPSGPAPGTVQDGYKFKGGNPADPASWEKQ